MDPIKEKKITSKNFDRLYRIGVILNTYKICLSFPKINTKRVLIYINMVSNESLGNNPLNRYKFNVLNDSQNFMET